MADLNDGPVVAGWDLIECRAGAIRAGENPDTVSCYICPETSTRPGMRPGGDA